MSEFSEKLDAMTEDEQEDCMDRMKHFLRTQIGIDLKVKNCGNGSFTATATHIEYLLPRDIYQAICKRVLAELEDAVLRSETRIAERMAETHMPPAILVHEKRLLIKRRTKRNRMKRAMEVLFPEAKP